MEGYNRRRKHNMEWEDAPIEEKKKVVLEAIKYFTAFGAPTGTEEEVIQNIAVDARELGITYEEVLIAVNEARRAQAEGLIAFLSSDEEDPIHGQVEEIFAQAGRKYPVADFLAEKERRSKTTSHFEVPPIQIGRSPECHWLRVKTRRGAGVVA